MRAMAKCGPGSFAQAGKRFGNLVVACFTHEETSYLHDEDPSEVLHAMLHHFAGEGRIEVETPEAKDYPCSQNIFVAWGFNAIPASTRHSRVCPGSE